MACKICWESFKDCKCEPILAIVKELYDISDQEVKDKIRELIEASIYNTDNVVDILEQVFSK